MSAGRPAPRRCPAFLIGAPASKQGKTTITAAVARHHRDQGRRVRVFKTGPDFLDPMVLERASGAPVYQLDRWMAGGAECRRLLHEAAGDAHLIIIEGVMGLYDGMHSSADLAQELDVPIVGVINADAMAQTFGALAHGLATYRAGVRFAGVLANNVASPRHAEMLREGIPPGLPYLGAIFRDDGISLPDRHLGLVQAGEVADIDRRLQRAARAVADTHLARLPPEVLFDAPGDQPLPKVLRGVRIAVARDAAFSFLYPANLELLERLGARLSYFSPLADLGLPAADSVYLPGGYPELYLGPLAANLAMKRALLGHARAGRPIYAECGGMLYLLDTLVDRHGARAQMVGLLRGEAAMQPRLAALGYQSLRLPQGELRGHTFHYSRLASPLSPVAHGMALRGGAGEPVYRDGSVVASYLHLYFPSCPMAAASLFMPLAASSELPSRGALHGPF